MFQPHAHHVLWFTATFLMLWAVSLIVRGAFHRPRLSGNRRGPRTVHKRAVVAGVILFPIAAGGFVVASQLRAWIFGPGARAEAFTAFHAIALGMAAFAMTLACWGLFADRAAGRKRCPKCWYEMDAVAAAGKLTCPECGHDARTQARLYKTRRSWPPVVAAGLIALATMFVPRLSAVGVSGPKALIPTTAMIAGMWSLPENWLFDTAGEDPGTLTERVSNNAYQWQRVWFGAKLRSEFAAPTSLARLERAWAIVDQIGASTDPSAASPQLAFCARKLGDADPSVRAHAAKLFREIADSSGFERREVMNAVAGCADEALPGLADADTNVVLAATFVQVAARKNLEAMIAAIERIAPSIVGVRLRMIATTRLAAVMNEHPSARDLLIQWTMLDESNAVATWWAIPKDIALPPEVAELADHTLRTTTSIDIARALAELRLAKSTTVDDRIRGLLDDASAPGPRRAPSIVALRFVPFALIRTQSREILAEAVRDSDVEVVMACLRWIDERVNDPAADLENLVEVEHLLGHFDEGVRSLAESIMIDIREAQRLKGIPDVPAFDEQ